MFDRTLQVSGVKIQVFSTKQKISALLNSPIELCNIEIFSMNAKKIKPLLKYFLIIASVVFLYCSCATIEDYVDAWKEYRNIKEKVEKIPRSAEGLENTFYELYQIVAPSVVSISAIREFYCGSTKQTISIFGNGFVISRDGLVVTSYDVAGDALSILTSVNNKKVEATVVGEDIWTNVVLIQLDRARLHSEKIEIKPLNLSTEQLKIGQIVATFSKPWDSPNAVITTGNIAAIRIDDKASKRSFVPKLLHTAETFNGSPIIDIHGNVIGMSIAGTYVGKNGVAIPASVIQEAILQFLRYGKTQWSWTGFKLDKLEISNANSFNIYGALISDVVKNSPADKSGIKKGDILTKFNEITIKPMSYEELIDINYIIAKTTLDKEVEIEIYRDGTPIRKKLRTKWIDDSELPHSSICQDYHRRKNIVGALNLGFTVEKIVDASAEELGISEPYGVRVISVNVGSNFRVGDIIKEITLDGYNQGITTNSLTDFQNAYNNIILVVRPKTINFKVLRDKQTEIIKLENIDWTGQNKR